MTADNGWEGGCRDEKVKLLIEELNRRAETFDWAHVYSIVDELYRITHETPADIKKGWY